MIQMIIRADDVGYSEAVNYGIEKSVKDGLIGSVGLMPNMSAAAHGLKLLEGTGVCIGQHTNVCLGKPCADPKLIPSLLDENGNLKSSRAYRAAFKENREIVELEELVIEIEAQYHHFVELVGHDPEYFEAHAVMSRNLSRALEIVAGKYQLPYCDMTPIDTVGTFKGREIASCAMGSMSPDYDPVQCLKDAVANASPDMPNIFVCHPGYLDAFLLKSSSLTVNRTKEVEMLCDPAVREWLKERGVELITYRDI
ncbi:MAG: ChbG/HpnK family deacetylase [Lachnospiraceae bacterium]|nr:ChbG/HpnK family deacetylase [Lachnospiraceae bacterium]